MLPDPSVRPTLTVQEVADLLRIGRSSAYAAVRSGEIPSMRVGHRLLVPTAALLRRLDAVSSDTAPLPASAGAPAQIGPDRASSRLAVL